QVADVNVGRQVFQRPGGDAAAGTVGSDVDGAVGTILDAGGDQVGDFLRFLMIALDRVQGMDAGIAFSPIVDIDFGVERGPQAVDDPQIVGHDPTDPDNVENHMP